MKKRILLAFIVHSSFVCAMGNDSWISTFSPLSLIICSVTQSSLPSRSPKKLQLPVNLRNDIHKFEEKLQIYVQQRFHKRIFPSTQIFLKDSIQENPNEFLQYCYYLQYHNSESRMSIDYLDTDKEFLKLCKDARFDGYPHYSAFSAVVLAPNVSCKEKNNFIQELIKRDIQPTSKDVELAFKVSCELIGADEQKTERKTTLKYLLHPHSHSPAHWRTLPEEIRKLIAWYLVEAIRKDYWIVV